MHLTYNLPNFLKSLAQKLDMDIDTQTERGLVLVFDAKYKIQLEFLEDRILLSCEIGEILVSRFRHQVFSDALKSNLKSSCFGSLGYSDLKKMLILILNYPISPPKEEEFFRLLEGFIIKAKAWTDALHAGNTRLLT